MPLIYLFVGLGFLCISIYVVWESKNLEYYTKLGPGGGFFPFWLGIIMGGLSLGWLLQEIRVKDKREFHFFPEGADIIRIILTVLALVGTACFMNFLGFKLTMFFFLMFLIKILGKQSLISTFLVAFLGSFGVYYLFANYLDVMLPKATIKFLSNLGL